MFVLCNYRNNALGVLDTSDGSVEYYSPNQLQSLVNSHKIKIAGFVNASDYDIASDSKTLRVIHTPARDKGKNFIPQLREIRYVRGLDKIQDLCEETEHFVLAPLIDYMQELFKATINKRVSLEFFRVFNTCLGCYNVPIPNSNCSLSIDFQIVNAEKGLLCYYTTFDITIRDNSSSAFVSLVYDMSHDINSVARDINKSIKEFEDKSL